MAERWPDLADAQRLAGLGFRPLWLSPPFSGGIGAGKHPVADGWESFHWVPPDDLDGPPGPGCNLGIMTGAVGLAPSRVIAVNCDTMAAVADTVAACGNTPMRIATQRGEILFYRAPEEASVPRGSRLRGIAGTSVLGDGLQTVVPPSIHKSGTVYREVSEWTPLLVASAVVFPIKVLDIETKLAAIEAVRAVVLKVPTTSATATWIGCAIATTRPSCVESVREMMPSGLVPSYDAGVQLAEAGSKVGRPAELDRSVVHRLRMALADTVDEGEIVEEVGLDYRIHRLVHRTMPASDEAHFDLTLEQGSRIAVITGLTGSELGKYTHIHGRAIDGGLVLPGPGKNTTPLWLERLSVAMQTREVRQEDAQYTAVSSAREIIIDILKNSKDASDTKSLRKGGVARTEDYVFAYGPHIIRTVRAKLPEDKLTRPQILSAARECRMHERRASLADGQRPWVWAFPVEALEE